MSYLARLVAHLSLERGHLDTDAFSYRLTQQFILNKMPCSKMFHVEHFEAWHFAVRKLLFLKMSFLPSYQTWQEGREKIDKRVSLCYIYLKKRKEL